MYDLFFQNLVKSFVAIDPISLIPIFSVITANLQPEKVVKLAIKVFFITSIVLTFFSLFGNHFLLFMGISIASFQIVGGLFLLFISFEMVFEKRDKRKKNYANDIVDQNKLNDLAVFPISIPLVAGPSAITLSVLVSKNLAFTLNSFFNQYFPIIIILFFTSILIFFSNIILKILNETVINILQKIFGILLGALSVEYIITGIKNL